MKDRPNMFFPSIQTKLLVYSRIIFFKLPMSRKIKFFILLFVNIQENNHFFVCKKGGKF